MKESDRRRLKMYWIIGAVFAFALFPSRPSRAGIPVERIDLPNRLIILVSEEHSLPFVTMRLLLDAGAWRDPDSKAGLANLTAESLLLGTARRPISELNEMLDFMGTNLTASCDWDYTVLGLKCLKKELDGSLDILMETLTQPAFPAAEFQREKEEILGEIEAEKDDPSTQARKRFRETVFRDGPYSQPLKGSKESLGALTRDSAVEFFRTYYRPNIAVLAVVGDITLGEVKDRLVPRLSSWAGGNIPELPVNTRFAESPQSSKEDRPITQANIVLGHGGIQRNNPDYYAVSVMNHILGGGGFSSRLMESIRVKKGLAYAVYSQFVTHKYPGTFQIVMQTKNASTHEALDLALQEVKRIQEEMVSEQELETAKKYLIGSFPLRIDTQSSLASFLAQAVYYGLGLDYPEKYPSFIRSVSREDVLLAAKKYLHPDNVVISIVGNLKEIGTPAGGGNK